MNTQSCVYTQAMKKKKLGTRRSVRAQMYTHPHGSKQAHGKFYKRYRLVVIFPDLLSVVVIVILPLGTNSEGTGVHPLCSLAIKVGGTREHTQWI